MPAMKEHVNGVPRYRQFIAGQWTESTVKEWIEVENPATGETIASVPRGTADDADRACVAAHQAQPAWEAMPPVERGALLRKLAQLVLENRNRLAHLVVAEQGKPLQEARGEIDGTALYLTYAAEEARRITGDIIPSDNADEQVWIQRVAHGVVLGLTAWNYPAALTTRKMGPALIAGNTIVIKPHEGTPLSAFEIAQLSVQAGFPPGVINVVSGTGEGIGTSLVKHPIPRLITLTGSVRAGKEIFRNSADDLKVLRQGAVHRRRGRRYRCRGQGGGRVPLRKLRTGLHLQRAHVSPREDRRPVHRAIRQGGEGAEGRQSARDRGCRAQIQRAGARQGRAAGAVGHRGRSEDPGRRKAPDRGRVRARALVRAHGADGGR
jgi:hypothetical protein